MAVDADDGVLSQLVVDDHPVGLGSNTGTVKYVQDRPSSKEGPQKSVLLHQFIELLSYFLGNHF